MHNSLLFALTFFGNRLHSRNQDATCNNNNKNDTLALKRMTHTTLATTGRHVSSRLLLLCVLLRTRHASAASLLYDVTQQRGWWSPTWNVHGWPAPAAANDTSTQQDAPGPQANPQSMHTQSVNNIYSASLDGNFVNNECDGVVQLTDSSVPVDTPNKAVSFWFYATGWPNQWPVLYDTTNTRGTPSYGHTIYFTQSSPGNPSSLGTLALCDWVGNCLSLPGWGLNNWYFVSACISRDPNAHTSSATLFLKTANAVYFAYASGNMPGAWTSINNIGAPYPYVTLGAKGTYWMELRQLLPGLH